MSNVSTEHSNVSTEFSTELFSTLVQYILIGGSVYSSTRYLYAYMALVYISSVSYPPVCTYVQNNDENRFKNMKYF